MVCGVVSVVGVNFGGCGLLLVVASEGYLAVIFSVDWDLARFGFGIWLSLYLPPISLFLPLDQCFYFDIWLCKVYILKFFVIKFVWMLRK